MGTVGLSFGSPTSGTGFDVSSTVASIVSNLQNVETPWKTQLTALQSQDTAISSLGTLFSNLSNDLSQLTDFQGIMAQKTGSSSDTNVLQLTSASTSATAGTHTVVVKSLATTSSGYLAPIADASDTLSGSISIEVGSGKAQTIDVPATSGNNNLAGLAAAINSSGVGVTASVLTDSSGSRLSLVSGTSGANGTIIVDPDSNSIVDTSNSNAALGYTASPVVPADAELTVDGVSLTSSSNTVTNLIPGLTFQLLAPSATESGGGLETVQVVIGNDNTEVESTVNQFVSDYNSLISAINTQEGLDSSGNSEPLFGSPTLSLLQQQLLGGLDLQNPNGYLDSIPNNTNTTLSGSITIQVGSGTTENIVIGAAPESPAANTIYTGSGINTLSGLASAITSAGIGVTAGVATQGANATLTLLSQTAGASGALSVDSSIVATGNTQLNYSDTGGYTSTTADSGSLDSIPSSTDVLSGSISIQVGGGTAKTITLDSSDNTLTELRDAINAAKIGVTASVVNNSDGTSSLSLVSGTVGSSGALSVTSNIQDTTNLTSSNLNYNNSSDVSTLANLGITVSDKDDGSLTFDDTTLDSVLNSDYSGVVGFFQNANSWGQSFSTMLTNAGTSSATGALSLAESANSSTESTLNADISKEESLISAQQTSLTAELNSANEIMQELPSQLQGVNELYSAITGYDENLNG
jgi:flagellar hook-associated protein 2